MHHFSVCVSDTGEAAVAHLRDFVPDEQRSAAEAGPVPDHSPPHRGAAYRPETGWWDPLLQLWDQPGPWWEDNLCGQLSAHFWLILKQKCMRLCDFHRTFNVQLIRHLHLEHISDAFDAWQSIRERLLKKVSSVESSSIPLHRYLHSNRPDLKASRLKTCCMLVYRLSYVRGLITPAKQQGRLQMARLIS